eukprot:341609-Rhodomonas_salina.5
MDDAAQVSRQVAERVGTELEIPVLTYGAAHASGYHCPYLQRICSATSGPDVGRAAHRRALAALRKQTSFFKKGPGEAQTPSSSGQNLFNSECNADPDCNLFLSQPAVPISSICMTSDLDLSCKTSSVRTSRSPLG